MKLQTGDTEFSLIEEQEQANLESELMIKRARDAFKRFRNCDFRVNQYETVEFVNESKKPITIIQAPTGFGKSLVGVVSGALFGQFTYLVSSKQLQDQLEKDFPEVEIMKGRNNYACTLMPGKMADACTHSKKMPCPFRKKMCPYDRKKKKVLKAKYRVLNYHYFLTEANYIGGFSGNQILICDEADLLESILTDFVNLQISGKLMREFKIEPPKFKTAEAKEGVKNWKHWAEVQVAPKLVDRMAELEQHIDPWNDENTNSKATKEQNRLKGILTKIKMFIENVDETWIMEESFYTNKGANTKGFKQLPALIFKPIWLTPQLSEMYFFKHTLKTVLMSATFPPIRVMTKLLGREFSAFDYPEFDNDKFGIPTSFPIENRPIILRPVADMSFKTFNKELPILIDEIIQILEEHKGQRGIIHSVSYKLNRHIMNIGQQRLMTHDSTNRNQVIENFKNAFREDTVLVSPSIQRGVDLPGKECEFVIHAKVPYKSLADKLTRRRVYSSKVGNLWYTSLTTQEIVQGCGRGNRKKSDYCVNYLLDKQFLRMLGLGKKKYKSPVNMKKLYPNYWYEALERY